ncbi:MAG: thioester reductase domain-containing protein [Clostridium sp.]|nr:thioester reductase domain-containing protein [Clostridium sp.]
MATKFEDILSEIRRIVDRFPDNPAVIEDGTMITSYREIWETARRIAGGIERRGTRSPYVVVEMEKSTEYICAILGCWMAGKGFVPCGTDLPNGRRDNIRRQIAADLVITMSNYPELSSALPVGHIAEPAPETTAYVIFSSGTTGEPKGIVVSHRGLVGLARAQRRAFRLDSRSRNLFFLSVNFDASVSDILVTLTSGASLLIERCSPVDLSADIAGVIARRQVTHADLPPSLLRTIDPERCTPTLRTIVIGGEAADRETVRRWAGRVNLVNVYGPTEATVCTSLCRCTGQWDRPVLGRELPGVKYNIYRDGSLTADEGELWISGDCLATGYLNRPELTSAKFPVVEGVRYYRTADHVRRLPDGSIEFLGRYDRQVKFHGQLVELEEIESNIRLLRFVTDAAVVKRRVGEENPREILAAFVELTDCDIAPEEPKPTILKFLRLHLPVWMIPGAIETVTKLPRVTSGKIDYKTLENRPLSASIGLPAGEPQFASDLERTTARIMGEILKIETVGPGDDFIRDLGADSMDTLYLITRLQSELDIAVSHDMLREDATAAGICRKAGTDFSSPADSRDLAGEWSLDIRPSFSSAEVGQGIMVTGSTGFLGSHILEQILLREEFDGCCIVCPVRCESPEHGLQRIRESFARYNIGLNPEGRVEVVPSDLSKERFGLTPEIYAGLAESVGRVFHCAATVNMMAGYGSLKDSNVTAVRRVLEFCLTGCRKTLNYASTLSVFVSTTRNREVAMETDRLDHPCRIYGGYGQTKYVAEKILLGVPREACGVNILRYGLLCGDTRFGISAPKDFLGLFVRAARGLGYLPWDNSGEMAVDITPVDLAAAATVDIATGSDGGIFHIAAERPLGYNRLCEILNRKAGIGIDREADVWLSRLEAEAPRPEAGALKMSLCRLIPAKFEQMRSMDLFQTTGIRFDMSRTRALTDRRIIYDDSLIEKYITNETIQNGLCPR